MTKIARIHILGLINRSVIVATKSINILSNFEGIKILNKILNNNFNINKEENKNRIKNKCNDFRKY